MDPFSSRKRRFTRARSLPHPTRLRVEVLEDRCCPSASFSAQFSPGASILSITALASSGDTSLTISGDTAPGGGTTSLVTVAGGPDTTVNGMAAVTFTLPSAGALTAINVAYLHGNDTLTIGTPTGIVNLPGTTLNVVEGNGNDTFTMGSPTVNNVLNAVNWTAADLNSLGTESVTILNAVVGNVTVQENNGPGNAIRLWGVTSGGQISLTQGHGAGDAISIDQLSAAAPAPAPAPPAPPGSPPASLAASLALVTTSQGNGAGDNTSINRSVMASYKGGQGNGDHDGLLLGTGNTVGALVTPPGGAATTLRDGSVQLTQGLGSGDYLGVDDLTAGVVSLVQQDLHTNAAGDQVGGVRTNAVAPSSAFGTAGLNAPSTTRTGLPNGAGGVAIVDHIVGSPSGLPLFVIAPTDGFRNALLEQLTITQGSAAGDIVALAQLPSGSTTSETLRVPGTPFPSGDGSAAGTITIVQQDVAGASADYVFLGSYTPDPNFKAALPGDPHYGSPPYVWTNPVATGSITAENFKVRQGDAFGDVLSVLFATASSPTAALSSVFVQGNGGDDAIFQRDTAVSGGLFNYSGGSGGNFVQADSNTAIGTFDGGGNVAFNVLGQDNNNAFLLFVDFGNVILA